MKYRRLGKTGFEISEISLGTWQVGGGWGSNFDDAMAEEIINTAVDRGVNFLDTADVYDDRASEAAVGRVAKARSERIYVATKCGRRLQPHVSESYTPAAMREFVEQSLSNTGLETLDLIQLHCPPTEVYYRPEVFEVFERMKEEGKIQNLGVSVEKVEEGLKAIEYPNVATVQIIFNMFRHRPSELFFHQARARDVGIIVRVPLASGLLSGKLTRSSTFSEGDHRNFNREGAAFDKGETFAGVPYDTGLDAVDALQRRLDDERPLPMLALKWILMHDEVSTVIPGASRPSQVEQNVEASETADLTGEQRDVVNDVYERYIKGYVHQRW
jgi:aryl-alcohol dehydrogenase-like predicted oxidoreductase